MTLATQAKTDAQTQKDAALAQALEGLRHSFRNGLDERICRIETAWVSFRKGLINEADARAAIEFEAHRISGVAGSVGLSHIGSQAAALEALVAERGNAAVLDAQINAFLDLLEEELTDV